jgi:hypothetical protein
MADECAPEIRQRQFPLGWKVGITRNVTINRNLTQLRFERPEPELELGQKNNSPSKQLSKRDRNDWGGDHGATARFSQRTFHWPLSGNPGAFFFGAPSQPAAISAVA